MIRQALQQFVAFTVLAAPLPAVLAAEPDGDQLLRQVCAKLADSRSFSFEAHREIDAALLEGHDVPEKARIAALVQRPNHLATQSISKSGTRRFVFDGSTLSIMDGGKDTYAIVPMRKSLDGLVAQLDEEYGFTPPLAEFALSDPYGNFKREARTVSYSGRERVAAGFLKLNGVECHRLSLKGKLADAELWIAVSDLLPRKLIATYHRSGNPQVRIAFSSWNLDAPVGASDFKFIPPKGAEKIEMWTITKMQSAAE